MTHRCRYVLSNGNRCSRKISKDIKFCWQHKDKKEYKKTNSQIIAYPSKKLCNDYKLTELKELAKSAEIKHSGMKKKRLCGLLEIPLRKQSKTGKKINENIEIAQLKLSQNIKRDSSLDKSFPVKNMNRRAKEIHNLIVETAKFSGKIRYSFLSFPKDVNIKEMFGLSQCIDSVFKKIQLYNTEDKELMFYPQSGLYGKDYTNILCFLYKQRTSIQREDFFEKEIVKFRITSINLMDMLNRLFFLAKRTRDIKLDIYEASYGSLKLVITR